MADILRVSFPGTEKTYVNPTKNAPDITSPFNIVDVSRVTKPQTDSSLLSQNNSLLSQNEAPTILQDMLCDPKVTVGFLRNIFMLQELFRLLPGNNNVITQELEDLFSELMVTPEELLGELVQQAASQTVFSGEGFNVLRELETGGNEQLKNAVSNLLKASVGEQKRSDIISSISNNLMFLGNSQEPLRSLSERFTELAKAFHSPDENFEDLKKQVLKLLSQQQSSLLNSPDLEKVSATLIYNLSRFQDNNDFLPNATQNLATLLAKIDNENPGFLTKLFSEMTDGELKSELLNLLSQKDYSGVLTRILQSSVKNGQNLTSKVMNALTEIITKEGRLADLQLISEGKINEIIASLLSSPCNYTPLLHFVIPLDFYNLRAFAEMWIDNNSESENGARDKDEQHLLIAFEIEEIGSFETEIFTIGSNINITILCPPEYQNAFAVLTDILPRLVSTCGYRLSTARIEPLYRGRSLMEVFSTLPQKRLGLSVKV